MNKRINSIEFLRFVFCLVVVNYHFYSHYLVKGVHRHFFCRGYIVDEFFFAVSGFFIAKKATNTKTENIGGFTANYLIRRIKKIALPYYICWFGSFIGIHLMKYWNSTGLIKLGGKYEISDSVFINLLNSIYELTFLDMFGFKKGMYSNQVAWYFSALVICILILTPFMIRYKNAFCLVAAPLISFSAYAFLSLKYDYLFSPHTVIDGLYIYKGMIRAVAGICGGAFLFGLVNMKPREYLINKVMERVIVLLLWIGILLYSLFPFESNYTETAIQYDYIVAILIIIALGITFHLDSMKNEGRLTKNKTFTRITDYMGSLSVYVFFAQSILYSFDKFIFILDISTLKKLLLFNLTAILLAIVLKLFCEKIRSKNNDESRL